MPIRPGLSVLAGVRIGDDAMVGTGAVVTKDIPPHAIALGIPGLGVMTEPAHLAADIAAASGCQYRHFQSVRSASQPSRMPIFLPSSFDRAW